YVLLHPGRISIRGKCAIDDHGASFSEAEISSGETRGIAEARLNTDMNVGLKVSAHFPYFDFTDLGSIGGIKFGGHGSVIGSVVGPYSHMVAQGNVELDETMVASIPFGHSKSE